MVKDPSAGHASDPFNQNFWLQAQTPDLLKLPVGPTEQPRPKLSTSHSLEWQFSIVQLISFVFYFYLFILAKLLRARRGMALSRLCPLFQQPHEVRKWIWERLQSVHMAAS